MTSPPEGAGSAGVMSPGKAILYGALVAGALDAADGVVFFGFQGLNPIQVLQYIASGLLGQQAFQGGLATAGLGALLHFGIAAVVAAIYVLAAMRLSILRSRAVVLGLVYGAAVYLVMNLLVLPMSAIGSNPISTAALLNGLIGHALFVGFPIAHFARKAVA